VEGEGGGRGARGEYRFSPLVKLKQKEENYAVFYFAGKRIFFICIYEVITWEKEKSAPDLTTSVCGLV